MAPPSQGPPVMGQGPPPAMAQGPPPAMPQAPPPSQAGEYNKAISDLLKTTEYTQAPETEKREKIGEQIYSYISNIAGENNAPKITGMIIDLPLQDLETSISTWATLTEKVNEGQALLNQDASN